MCKPIRYKTKFVISNMNSSLCRCYFSVLVSLKPRQNGVFFLGKKNATVLFFMVPFSTKNGKKTSGRHFSGFLEGYADSTMELIESRWEGVQRNSKVPLLIPLKLTPGLKNISLSRNSLIRNIFVMSWHNNCSFQCCHIPPKATNVKKSFLVFMCVSY